MNNFGKFEIGNEQALSSEDENERKVLKAINEEYGDLFLSTRITSGSRCGFANSGTIVYLANLHSRNRYRVVIRRNYRHDRGQTGHVDLTQDLNPSARVNLGCSVYGMTPGSITRYSYQIISETRI